ncbi:hypothetical protein [Pedobacter nutrimenti]|jgi:hypothetical protein|uniref:Uncharacterized protein n=1 Tax=Pedobacter nutrimenti TaxID=1241337 RepID=A0A318UMT3_9SPHI|nr:hypothetical protein [Pedobacter nutrimenti]PYF76840.1 hypothetical protein B0O44_101315 [Pedobacter nutrimenti]
MKALLYKNNHLSNLLKSFSIFSVLFFLLNPGHLYAQSHKRSRIHIGLVYPLSSNGSNAARDTNDLSLNLIAGVSAAERGPAIAGVSNIIHHDATSVTIAGFSNHLGGNASGALISGVLNTYKGGSGAAVAGLGNIAGGSVSGIQVGGIVNTAKNVNGVQIAGGLNKADSVSSLQVAGFMNLAGNTKGSQIAGFLNIAKKVKGVQIAGFLNVADSSDYPIGIINLVKNGEKSLGVTLDENMTTLLTFRSGGKVLYGIIGAGYNFRNTDAVYAIEAGLGAHTFQSGNFRLNLELAGTTLTKFKRGDFWKTSLRVLPAYKIGSRLEIFGGPSINYSTTNTAEGRDLVKHYISKWDGKNSGNQMGFYVGYMAGVQVHF